MYMNKNVCIIIPALNEAPSIGRVIDELFALQVCRHGFAATGKPSILHHCAGNNKSYIASGAYSVPLCEQGCESADRRLVDHIVVCDNGSTDGTADIARASGAIVVSEAEKGYGAACQAGMAAMPETTDVIAFVDADYSVDAKELPALLYPITLGADIVIGSRTLGRCEKGALSFPQKYGNALASVIINLLWNARVSDLGPFRAVTRAALGEINMQDRQFGWTVEMQIRALQLSQAMVEVPVTTRVRIGKSKIGGTVRGVIGASRGILGTIFKLYLRHRGVVSDESVKRVNVRSTSDRLAE
jgi:glycosyltransferase involved in cell wall biosynthesis